MSKNLAKILNDRGIVYGSGNKLMGFHSGLKNPVQIGPEHKGVIASLAYANGTLYHVEQLNPITELYIFRPKTSYAEDAKNFMLLETLTGKPISRGIYDISNFKGELIAVASDPEEPGDAIIIEPLSGKQITKIKNIRTLDSGYAWSFLRIGSADGCIYIGGHKAVARYNTSESGHAKVISGSTKRRQTERIIAPSSYLVTSKSGIGGVFEISNIIDFPTEDHVSLRNILDGRLHFVWSLWKHGNNSVYMATVLDDHVIFGTEGENGNNLYAVDVKIGKDGKEYKPQDLSHEVKPILLLRNAFETGESAPKNNPMAIIPRKIQLDEIIERSEIRHPLPLPASIAV